MRDDPTHLIALTIDRSDWIISEISRGKRPYSPVPFLNGELLTGIAKSSNTIIVNLSICCFWFCLGLLRFLFFFPWTLTLINY